MKRFMIGAFLLMLLIFTACSQGTEGEGNDPNNNNGNNSSQNNEKPDNNKGNKDNDEEEVTINFYSWQPESAYADIIANFERDNPNIKINYDSLVTSNDSVEFYQKLDIQIGGGEKVDVVAFSHVDFLVERAARGVLAPIDDLLKADSIDPAEEFFITPAYDGKVYGVQNLSQPWLVAINKNMLDEAGLSIPEWGWTWEDFAEYAEKLTTDDHKGAYFHTWGEYASFPAYSELPHPYLTADEEPVFDHDIFKDFFDLRRQMEEDGSVEKFQDVIAGNLHYASEYFNEKTAMLPIGSFILEQIIDQEKYPHDFLTVFAPLPRSSSNVEVGSSYVGGQYLAVGESSDHKEEAYKFAIYLAQQTEAIKELPGSRSVDQDLVIDKIVDGNDRLIDKESLTNTVYDDRIYVPYDATYATPYASQLKGVLEDGFSLYILDDRDAAEAQEEMIKQANRIKEQNE